MSFTQDPHDNKILQLCRDGKVAEAIKLHKELTGAALKESKDYVDGLRSLKAIKLVLSPPCVMVIMMHRIF